MNSLFALISKLAQDVLQKSVRPIIDIIIDSNFLPKKLTSETRLAKSSGFRLSKENFRFALANFGAKKLKKLPNHVMLTQSVVSFKNASRSHILKLPKLN